MVPLSILVLYLQGSDAGQKCLKISRIFNFDVPLWMIRITSCLVTTKECISILDKEWSLSCRNRSCRFQRCIYNWFGDLAGWWTPFRIGHFALQLPDFTYVSPKFDQLVLLNYACPCIPSYRKVMYEYVEQAQKIWSLHPYWFSIYRAPMQVKND